MVGIETEVDAGEVRCFAGIARVDDQVGACGGDAIYFERSCADRARIVLRFAHLRDGHILPDVRRQQADGGIVQEGRQQLGEREAHCQAVGAVGRFNLHCAPEGAEPGYAGELFGLHRADRVEHIGGGDGMTVVPDEAGTEQEVIDQSIFADSPAFRQVGDDIALLIQPGEAVEEQGDQGIIYLVVLAEQGVEVLRVAGNALNIDTAPIGDGDCGEAVGRVAQEGSQQRNAQEGDNSLPA